MPLSHLRRHKGRSFLVLLVLLVVIYFGWETWTRRGAKEAAGIYLANGGRSLVILTSKIPNRLVWEEGFFHQYSLSNPLPPTKTAEMSNGRLIMVHSTANRPGTHSKGQDLLRLELSPSQEVNGDWDLVGANHSIRHKRTYTFPPPPGGAVRMPPQAGVWGTLKATWERLRAVWGRILESSREYLDGLPLKRQSDLDPGTTPVRSFLHSVDDPRLIEYFHACAQERLTPPELENFRQLYADHPDDPFLTVHAIDVEARFGNIERAATLSNDWREQLEGAADPLLRESAKIAFKSVAEAQGRLEGRDLRKWLSQFNGTERNLKERFALLEELLEHDHLFTTTWPLIPTEENLQGLGVGNYLDLQINARVAKTVANLDLFSGRRHESLKLLAGLYKQGLMMSEEGYLTQQLIGIAIRLIAASGLHVLILNACQSTEELLEAWQVLEKFDQAVADKKFGIDVLEGGYPLLDTYMKVTGGEIFDTSRQAITRHKVTETNLQLLRTAVAAAHRFVMTGDFPSSASEFAPLLPSGLPADPFSGRSIRYTSERVEPFAVYSVGPDEKDNLAGHRYAPTNGTLSSGDIFVRLPKEREYPFPKDGLVAKDATTVLEAFPNGLPYDPFAWTTRLSILDSTPNDPVFIYGFGPAGYSRRWSTNLDPRYDPTNGVKSPGHLFIEIPRQ